MNIKHTSLIFLMSSAVLFSACKQQDNHVSKATNQVTVNQVERPTIETVAIPTEFSPHATQVADAVQASRARLASEKSEICPKLIEFTIDNKLVVRQHEMMRRQSCKYFLYPDIGTELEVNLDNDKLQANIVQPEFYSFLDGKYLVTSRGKHVLEISYKDHHGDRTPEKYSLSVTNY